MALIKCPECGKEMSDMAESCPQCGMPINEIKAASGKPNVNTPKIQSKAEKNGMPKWGWILIIVGSLLIVGGIVFFCFMGKSSDFKDVHEEAVQISYPDITTQGVKPFFVGSSMYDIPAKGDFYDTILLEKKYNAFEECGEMHYDGLNEKELLKIKQEWGDIFIVKSYGYAFVIKDNDTLIRMDFDENAVIHSIEVFSEQIKMQNGVHVGLSASEMFEKYNALFITPSSFNTELLENDEDDNYTTFELPYQPTNISVKAVREKIDFEYKEQYENRLVEQEIYEGFDTLPLEAVKGSSVRSILIQK